jgi:hypothetical protein
MALCTQAASTALGPASYEMAQPSRDFRTETKNRGKLFPVAAGGFAGRIRPAGNEGLGKVLPGRTTGPQVTD